LAVHTALQAPHLRRGIGLHRPPLAVRRAGGLPSLLAGRLLIGSGICLDLLDARPDLRAGFLTGLIRGILQMVTCSCSASTRSRRRSDSSPLICSLRPDSAWAWQLTAKARL
jgi:hypothetical protein